MHTKSRNIEIMKGDKTDEITKKLFESLLQNYNKTLEEAMRTSEFVTNSNDLLYYHPQKNRLEKSWIIHRYPLTASLNYQNIDNNPQRISKIKPFID